jgi:hypothetical protein
MKVFSKWMKKILTAGLLLAGGVNMFGDLEEFIVPIVNNEQCPVVDGKIIPQEWVRATEMTGLVALDIKGLATRQSKVYYISDGKYIYVGMISPNVPANTAPEITDQGNITKLLTKTDRVEVKFSPVDGIAYYFIADAAGNIYDEIIKTDHKKFNGPWEYKSSYDKDNWYVEMRIKAEALGVKEIKSGDKWKLNFSRAWLFPSQYTGLRRWPHQMAEATFIKDAPAIQIKKLGEIRKGKMDVVITAREYEGAINVPREAVYDFTATQGSDSKVKPSGKKIAVNCEISSKDGKVEIKEERTIPLAPKFAIKTEIKKDFTVSPENTFKLEARESGSGLVLYKAEIPFKPFDAKFVQGFNERLEKGSVIGSWRLLTAFFPYWEKAKISARFFAGKTQQQTVKIKIKISSDKGFSKELEIPVKNGFPETKEIAIPGMPEGTYIIKAELIDKDGKVLSAKENKYTRKVFPWEHNKLGLSRKVIKPWTPITVEGDNVKMWARDYKLDSLGLPEAIISKGKDILTEPVFMELTDTEGKSVKSSGTGSVKFTEKANDLVKWLGQGTLGKNIEVKINGEAEYDGYTWYKITLIPKQPVKVKNMTLTIPLKEQTAQLMHCQGRGARANFSGAIPNGKGTVYDSLQQARTSHMPGAFLPHIWIGNPNRGLCYFADSNQGWSSATNKPANEIVRTGNKVSLVLNIINKETTLDKPRTIELGMMATPIKPLIPYKDIVTRAVNWLGADNRTVFQEAQYSPFPKNFDYEFATKEINKYRDHWKAEGVRLYFNKHELPYVQEEVTVFDNEWGGMEPAQAYPASIKRFPEGKKGYSICRKLTDSRIDMLVYYVAEMAKKTPMMGTYWDITGIYDGLPMVENGTAYVNEDGKIVPTWNVRKSRQLFKRIATAWQEVRGEPDYMEIHSTNHIGLPFYGFGYQFLNFEWRWINPKLLNEDGTQKDYIDLRPLDTFTTEGVPSQFGVWIHPIVRLGESRFKNPDDFKFRRQAERSVTILAALHNHINNPLRTIGKIDEVDFIGYWDENGKVTSSHPELKISLWQKGKDIELIVANVGKKTLTESVSIDLKQLGLSGVKQVQETTSELELEKLKNFYVSKKKLDKAEKIEKVFEGLKKKDNSFKDETKDGKLTLNLTVKPHDYRVFKITAE